MVHKLADEFDYCFLCHSQCDVRPLMDSVAPKMIPMMHKIPSNDTLFQQKLLFDMLATWTDLLAKGVQVNKNLQGGR